MLDVWAAVCLGSYSLDRGVRPKLFLISALCSQNSSTTSELLTGGFSGFVDSSGVGPDSGGLKEGGDSVEDWCTETDTSCSSWSHGLDSLTELAPISVSSLYPSYDSGYSNHERIRETIIRMGKNSRRVLESSQYNFCGGSGAAFQLLLNKH